MVYWYHWFKTAAAWYSHVTLDCIEPDAHWEGLQAMIMQQQDLISSPLDLSSPSVISIRTLFTFILQPEYLHRFSFALLPVPFFNTHETEHIPPSLGK